ncbi:hypothetical protein D9M71_763720 [compost metagenome]
MRLATLLAALTGQLPGSIIFTRKFVALFVAADQTCIESVVLVIGGQRTGNLPPDGALAQRQIVFIFDRFAAGRCNGSRLLFAAIEVVMMLSLATRT